MFAGLPVAELPVAGCRSSPNPVILSREDGEGTQNTPHVACAT
jgi:hypothetical protein